MYNIISFEMPRKKILLLCHFFFLGFPSQKINFFNPLTYIFLAQQFVLRLSEDDPRKMDEIRRLSAIFVRTSESGKRSKGSGSSGHKSNGPARTFSIHELVMNEAAAQLCKLVPALLTKRDELHSLVRQVVQESGLPYAIISANSNLPNPFPPHIINNNNNEVSSTSMRAKLDELRNSPASEERITHEFAAACKKIKLMESAGAEGQVMRINDFCQYFILSFLIYGATLHHIMISFLNFAPGFEKWDASHRKSQSTSEKATTTGK